mmetsp:Transcript_11630/g.32752  ORF Transcript_11630/g.32752 Transcript_11630/m.32752 type:complete len:269 (-) Transcript_11630:9499-10305(-)
MICADSTVVRIQATSDRGPDQLGVGGVARRFGEAGDESSRHKLIHKLVTHPFNHAKGGSAQEVRVAEAPGVSIPLHVAELGKGRNGCHVVAAASRSSFFGEAFFNGTRMPLAVARHRQNPGIPVGQRARDREDRVKAVEYHPIHEHLSQHWRDGQRRQVPPEQRQILSALLKGPNTLQKRHCRLNCLRYWRFRSLGKEIGDFVRLHPRRAPGGLKQFDLQHHLVQGRPHQLRRLIFVHGVVSLARVHLKSEPLATSACAATALSRRGL